MDSGVSPPAPPSHSVAGYTLLRGLTVDRAGALVAGRQDTTQRAVVVRVLSPAITADARYMRRLRHDVTPLMVLRDPNLVAVLAFDDHARALVYESVTGATLREILAAGGPLEPAAALMLFDDCLQGLRALHGAGLLHRDVRPEAVLIDRAGSASLRDACVPSPPLHAGWRAGTPQYMAPELWDGADHSVASDIYACTCILLEALTGEPAFATQSVDELRKLHHAIPASVQGLSPALRALVETGLSADPDDRHLSSVRTQLAAAAGEELGKGWRAAGRSRLRTAVARGLEVVAATHSGRTPSRRQRDAEGDSLALMPLLRRRLGRRWIAAAAAVAAAVIAALTLLAVNAQPREPVAASVGPAATATPSDGGGGPFATTPGDFSSASPTVSPATTPTPPRITPSSARPSLAPTASASPSSLGTPPVSPSGGCPVLVCPTPGPT